MTGDQRQAQVPGSPGPCKEASTAEEPDAHDEFRALARRLTAQGFELSTLRPHYEATSSLRGMPAVMRVLMEEGGPVSPGEIARRTGVTDARIANALRALEERGLVERHPSEHDRRRVEVSLTDAGRESVRDHARGAARFVTGFLVELGLDDARDLVRLLDRMLEVIRARRARGEVPEPPCADSPARECRPNHEERRGNSPVDGNNGGKCHDGEGHDGRGGHDIGDGHNGREGRA